MATTDKSARIAELTESFRNSDAAVLTEYRGLTVESITELRNAIREHATYSVAKNTLARIAAKEAGVHAFDGQLSGPTAIAFITGDVVAVAKGMRDFAKDNPLLVIKGGVLDGKALTAQEVDKLAELDNRETLLAKIAGGMTASLSQAAALFNAPLSKTVRTVEALRAKNDVDDAA